MLKEQLARKKGMIHSQLKTLRKLKLFALTEEFDVNRKRSIILETPEGLREVQWNFQLTVAKWPPSMGQPSKRFWGIRYAGQKSLLHQIFSATFRYPQIKCWWCVSENVTTRSWQLNVEFTKTWYSMNHSMNTNTNNNNTTWGTGKERCVYQIDDYNEMADEKYLIELRSGKWNKRFTDTGTLAI